MRAALLAALLAALVTLPCLAAEEEPPAVRIPEVRHLEHLSDERAGKAYALLGQIHLAPSPHFSVRARRMIVWLDPKFEQTVLKLLPELRGEEEIVPIWAVRAIYAEGGRSAAVFQAAGTIFRCSSVYYDFTNHTGLILDAGLRLERHSPYGELFDMVLRAKRFRATGPGEWRASQVSVFTSNYHEPEVELEVRRVVLRDRLVAEALGRLLRITRKTREELGGPTRKELATILDDLEKAVKSRGGKQLTMEGLTFKAMGVPFLGWHRVRINTDSDPPLRFEGDFGGKGSVGDGVRLGIGLDLGAVNWLVGVGYYDRRGPLLDADVAIDAFDGALFGHSFGVFLHDHGEDFGVEPSTRNRYWVQNRYRWRIDEWWRLDAEQADISDATWLRVYDEREFKEGKEQETRLTLRRKGRVAYWSLSGKVRAIDFLDVVEELPRLRAVLPVLTLWTNDAVALQLAATAEMGQLRFRSGDTNPSPDFRTARFDADPTLALSFDAGPWRVVPFATARVTAYEHDLTLSTLARFAGSAGVRADLQLARRYTAVLHVVNLSFEFTDLFHVSESASRLFPIDDVDRLTRYRQVGVRVRNRWFRGPREFLDLELLATWFPGRERPLGATGEGFFELDAEWTPLARVFVGGRASLDWDRRRLDTAAVQGRWEVRSDLGLQLGFRHLDGDSDIVSADAEFEVDSRWRVGVFAQYDVRNDDFLDQGVLIQRLGETVAFGLRFSFDPGDNDFSVSLKVDLIERMRRKSQRAEGDFQRRARWR